MTNTGTEKPATENADKPRSNQPPMRQAARLPRGTAIHTASSTVPSASAKVGSTRCATKAVTGLLR